MGLSVAYAVRHHNVTLFDPSGLPADNASARAGGMLAPYAEIDHLPENFLGAALHGISIWKNIAAKNDIGFMANGSLLVAHKEDEYVLERLAAKLPGVPRIKAEKIAALEPALGNRFNAGIYLEQEAHLNPQQVLKALAQDIKFEMQAVAPQKIAKDFDIVIDARGYRAEMDDKELRGVKGEIAIVRNTEFSLSRPVRVMHPRYPLYIVPRPGNIFMIGATVIESADEGLSVKSALELLTTAYSLHPSFGEAEIMEMRVGIRPAYSNNLPRIGFDGNVIRCNGLFRHGYLMAPVMAQCVADHIAGRSNNFISLFLNRHPERSAKREVEGSKTKKDLSTTDLRSSAQDDKKGETDDHHDQRAKEKYQRRA